MKKITQYNYCSRCGDDLDTEEEIEIKANPVCLWCQHMQAEAYEMNWQSQQTNAINLKIYNKQVD
ncbi:hypothetical protein [Methylicorpusculum sp.]|uniref:hypothetical protein n=1 Tax=Methylicorpusculum sp. TaxID=2713644 RepID=UPI002731E012|nr:hypothetical protein [Methylicorpusculum sp.]MDP2178374.1 hypothetical protein [Methylicorpusculum sp.]MDP3531464.1 hypothetical protein [Methylicorpusculum sp.]MDZ4151293.1 hypothetical protein [Methylicorpusculum sp.]